MGVKDKTVRTPEESREGWRYYYWNKILWQRCGANVSRIAL